MPAAARTLRVPATAPLAEIEQERIDAPYSIGGPVAALHDELTARLVHGRVFGQPSKTERGIVMLSRTAGVASLAGAYALTAWFIFG